jgi:hypothetical protein
MKTRISFFFLIIFLFLSHLTIAQYIGPSAANSGQRVVFSITKEKGSEDILKQAGNINAVFHFEQIGVNWNMQSEEEYLRYKILQHYILHKKKGGESWKKKYFNQKIYLHERFDRYMKSRLKKKAFKISMLFTNTQYTAHVYFIDRAKNIQKSDYYAIFCFRDNKTNEIVLQYRVEVKYKDPDNLLMPESQKTGSSFWGLSMAMSNYFKKYL